MNMLRYTKEQPRPMEDEHISPADEVVLAP